jgi:lysophospholipase L1-like esterase
MPTRSGFSRRICHAKVKFFKIFFVTAVWLSLWCDGNPVLAAEAQLLPDQAAHEEKGNLIPASDPRFRYEGRFDFSDSNASVVIWQASRISLDFSGDWIRPVFSDAKGQCFFNAEVDGSNTIVEVLEGKPVNPAILFSPGAGRHHLVLFKRSEATAGTVRFSGIEISPTAKAWSPPLISHKVKMEFIGDSITVGACNEDGAADQWENRRTHNAANSYAALTAAAFSADYQNISVSGMGIITGYVPMTAAETWDRLYPETNSPRADLKTWQPQIVFINFGENDGSFSSGHGKPFPTNFATGYVSLVQTVRKVYPTAKIVLLRGGMFNGAKNESLRQAWNAAVQQLEASDKAVSHFVFQHWTPNHPRVADDRAMADELIAWLKQQPFMKTYQ